MKQRTAYTWEKDDPSIEFVEHAISRLASFRSFLDTTDIKAEKSCNKVLQGNDFTAEDVQAVAEFMCELGRRAKTKWQGTPIATSSPEFAASIVQAADNAEKVSKDLLRIFDTCQQANSIAACGQE